jgi:hypothetical protein
MSDTEKSKATSRWWEYYTVRYFVGTIVGAGAMLMFNEYSASPLKEKLFPVISSFKDAGIHHLLVLVALGLAYCYIASAPILTIHALRGEIHFGAKRCFSCATLWFVGVFSALLLGTYLALALSLYSWQFLALAFVCLTLALQVTLYIEAQRNRFERMSRYYWSLSSARASSAPEVQEYVESYRHLREHGNAFAIIFFELGFALAAISVSSILLLAWIAPAAAVWFVGTILEVKLANAPRQDGKPINPPDAAR